MSRVTLHFDSVPTDELAHLLMAHREQILDETATPVSCTTNDARNAGGGAFVRVGGADHWNVTTMALRPEQAEAMLVAWRDGLDERDKRRAEWSAAHPLTVISS